MSDAPIIEARGLNLWYGPNHALKDISVYWDKAIMLMMGTKMA